MADVLRQLVSLMTDAQFGVLLGFAFSGAAVLVNVLRPLLNQRSDVRAAFKTAAVTTLATVGAALLAFGVADHVKAAIVLPAFVVVGAFCGAIGASTNRAASAIR